MPILIAVILITLVYLALPFMLLIIKGAFYLFFGFFVAGALLEAVNQLLE